MGVPYPRVRPVGDRALTVELGSSLDLETVARVRALDEELGARAIPGVLEAVPTYASLLVIYDRALVAFASLSETLLDMAGRRAGSMPSGQRVEIPALYDGEDLEEVAGACGLSVDSLVERHSEREYSVLMLGFYPGFAYMGFVDPALRVPRRRTPRTRVPEGAIAVAGEQTGIYPRALPGGWNLIGRTTLPLFDTASSRPSLLMPGDRVRFVPGTSLPPARSTDVTRYGGAGVEVMEGGILTTVQDSGRAGFRRVAVPQAGFADPRAARSANICVGNSPDSPLLELCAAGLKLRFEKTCFLAIAGARLTAHLERDDLVEGPMAVPAGVAVRARPGNVLAVTGLEDGVRAYIAISGLESTTVLGSASADLGSGFLRPLAAGDRLGIGPFDPDRAHRAPLAAISPPDRIRVIPGPQSDHFDPETIETLLSTPWHVGLDSDRVGARLDGPRLRHAGASEIVSDGMVQGCIQVPPDGRPIVMLSDCPTTGGYPKIACVVSEDLGAIAQAIPGRTPIRFTVVEIETLP